VQTTTGLFSFSNVETSGVYFYSKSAQDVALRIQKEIGKLVEGVPEYRTVPNRYFGLGVTLQEALAESGVDIEVVL